ncbi:hypothetical protein CRUP_007130, partial [Coryphaenoides rupestris]
MQYGQTLITGEAPPSSSSSQQEVQLKFLLTGLLSGLPLPPFAIRMGIEWVSLTSFLSFATSTPNNMGMVRNELQHYLVVVFRDKPLELWDIRTGTLLREMAKNFPTVTALEWSPSHNLKSLKKKQMAAREAMARQTVSDAEQSSVESSVISMLQDAECRSEGSQAISAREHFVFTDTDGQVYHITVEGNTVKDGARIPPDVSSTRQSSGPTVLVVFTEYHFGAPVGKKKPQKSIKVHK